MKKSNVKSRINHFFIFHLVILLFLGINNLKSQSGFVVDHTCTNLNDIPDYWIDKAKSDLHIAYDHTSHGSQPITGMDALMDYPDFGSKYDWVDDSHGDDQHLSLDDHGIPGAPHDLSQGDTDNDGDGYADWANKTYDFLDDPNNYHINVILWSWCNIAGHNIPRYLNSMDWLINNFSEGGTHSRAALHPVKFVFITAHANGGGEGDSSDAPNDDIRAHVAANSDRILFDFADIENYNPDNDYFLDKLLEDDLDYDSDNNGTKDANWAVNYLADYDDSELDRITTGDNVSGYNGCGSCAHSNKGDNNEARLNCVLKSRAFWYMFARLAGWDGSTTSTQIPEINSLSVKVIEDKSILDWTVTDIYDFVEFSIEYSTDGYNFSPIGKIDCDNQTDTKKFRFVHNDIVEGYNYYRIKIIDQEGLFIYSNIVNVYFNKKSDFILYPNPAKDYIKIIHHQKALISIYNNKGEKVKNVVLLPGQSTIDISNLPIGIYYIKNKNIVLKIIKE